MVSASVAGLLKSRVRFELECIDRMYLNLYVPGLQTPEGLVGFLRKEPGVKVFSTNSIAPMTHAFVSSIERFAHSHGLALIDSPKESARKTSRWSTAGSSAGRRACCSSAELRRRRVSSAP
jgi:hypothetical protein